MNDEELITVVREQRAKVHSATSVEQIISRGRAVRTRRRIPGVAGALAVVAGAAVAVTALVPASNSASHQPSAQLAAWTVVKQADGKQVRVVLGDRLVDPTIPRGGLFGGAAFDCTAGIESAEVEEYAKP